MYIETHQPLPFTPLPETTHSSPEQDLIASQLQFGQVYACEAHSARKCGDMEYYGVARMIAQNAYAAALRFTHRLPDRVATELSGELAKLEAELENLPP